MRVGEEFVVSLEAMIKPQIGNLVEVAVEGEPVRVLARIMSISKDGAVLKAVPMTTRE
jgi:hypothetical protein